jgi:type I restriction enzyme, R subunit
VLLFIRAVRSRVLFEQMLGRGTRVISETDFQAVTTTPQAHKTRFVIVDAVEVTEQPLVDTGTVERKRSVPLKALLEAVAVGTVDEDILASLARRLGLLEKRLMGGQRQEIERLLDMPAAPERFRDLRQLSNAMLDAIDPDAIYQVASESVGADGVRPEEADLEATRQQLVQRAVIPLAASPELRNYLLEREILIDETSVDEVLEMGFDRDATAHARQLVESFQQFIQENKDEITALQVLFSQPYGRRRLDYEQVRQLAERLNETLRQGEPLLMTNNLWHAYQQLEKDRVRGAGEKRVLADLVSLVRHAALDEELLPYPERVGKRYQDWLEMQAAGGKQFTPQERWWLDEIARHIGINLSIRVEDLNSYGFQNRGGQVAAQRLFGAKLEVLIEELNMRLGN